MAEEQLPPPTRQRLITATTIWLALCLFLAPVKLGVTVNVSNVGFFPLDVLGWLFEIWPPMIAPVIAGVGLILAVLAHPPSGHLLRRNLHLWLPSALLVLVCLIGFIRTTEWEIAVTYVWMLLALPLFTIALILHLSHRPVDRYWLFAGLVAGLVIVGIYGWFQHLYSFEETLRQLQDQQAKGLVVNEGIIARLREGRIMSTFTYPNNLAAHLLLVTPLALYLTWRWAARVDPPRPSQWTLTLILATLFLGAFFLSGSRAAIVALILGFLATLLLLGVQRRQWLRHHLGIVIGVGMLLAIGAIGGYLVIDGGRGLGSFQARLDYWRSAWLMFLDQPLTGVGLGEFYTWHLRLKPANAEVTRVAHNALLSFLSQTGIAGGLALLYFLIAPLLAWWRIWRDGNQRHIDWLWLAAFAGWASWSAHSFADFNFQIPGTLLTAVALPILCLDLGTAPAIARPSRILRPMLILIALFGIANLWQARGEYLYQRFYYRIQDTTRPPLTVHATRQQVETIARWKPFSPYPWESLGLIAMRQEQYAVAAEAFAEAVARAPHRPAFHARLAEAHLAMGDLQAARQHIRNALLWYPLDPKYQQLDAIIQDADRLSAP